AAAGMAGVFATPIAAILIAFELLVFERSLRALVPLLCATTVSTALHTALIGSRPLFFVRSTLAVPDRQLPLFVCLGLVAGALAVVLTKGLFAIEALFRRLPVPTSVHPFIGALGFACIGIAVPGSLSVGYWAISDSVNGRFLAGAAAVLFAGKLCSWWVALASGTSGGTLAPIFLVGATMGELVGIGFAHLFPGAHVAPATFAVVAMGACFGVSARAQLSGAVFALEVTGAWHLVVPMLLALAVGELVAEQFLDDRLMTDKLVRRGFRVEFDTEVDPFRTAVARQAMDPLPGRSDAGAAPHGAAVPEPSAVRPSIDASAYLCDALPAFVGSDLDALVVTDGGVPVGLLRRTVVTEVLTRRLAESVPQPPTLRRRRRLPSTGTGGGHVIPTGGGRVPRLDETHDGAATIEEDGRTHEVTFPEEDGSPA
ncbi:MAG TPA: chloride channel protein, partial [Acidimicrobiales bacterium]|nr:chloride channel protein [Acidimicrobiales bacterium]